MHFSPSVIQHGVINMFFINTTFILNSAYIYILTSANGRLGKTIIAFFEEMNSIITPIVDKIKIIVF